MSLITFSIVVPTEEHKQTAAKVLSKLEAVYSFEIDEHLNVIRVVTTGNLTSEEIRKQLSEAGI